MNLTTKQKVYGGLLILAVGAVLVDRVIIGIDVASPQQASAKAVQPPVAVDGVAGVGSLEDVAVPDRDQLIASRLAAVAQQQGLEFGDLRDGFEPAQSWLGKPQQAADAQLTPEAFRGRYPLMAVFTTAGKSYAVVGGQTLRVGQALEGFKLVAIQRRRVLFVSAHGRVVLKLSTKP